MRIGIEMVPEHGDVIKRSSNSMRMWIDLTDVWKICDDSIKIKLARFARSCLRMKGDVVNSVFCGFIEHVFDNRLNWPILMSVFSIDDVIELKWLWEYNYKNKSNDFINEIRQFKSISINNKNRPTR